MDLQDRLRKVLSSDRGVRCSSGNGCAEAEDTEEGMSADTWCDTRLVQSTELVASGNVLQPSHRRVYISFLALANTPDHMLFRA